MSQRKVEELKKEDSINAARHWLHALVTLTSISLWKLVAEPEIVLFLNAVTSSVMKLWLPLVNKVSTIGHMLF